MEKKCKRLIWLGVVFLCAFVIWTVLVCLVDVRPIGPCETSVGFATVNGFVHGLTGSHAWLYTLTDVLGLVPIGVAFGFAVLGLIQWIRRRCLVKVDRSILLLGGFYVLVIAIYAFFEVVVINYRPVLILGALEASYPSSTTMLVTSVIPTAAIELKRRIRGRILSKIIILTALTFTVFMVIARLISGVHWVSDIIGGALFSFGAVTMYRAALLLK